MQQVTNELLTIQEVADILRWDSTTVRRHIKHGTIEAIELPHINDRTAYRIRRSTLDAILNPEKRSA